MGILYLMGAISSNTSFLTIGTVAEEAQVTRQTIYTWLDRGLIAARYDVEDTPVFTPAERDAVVKIARARKHYRESLELPRSSNTSR